MGRNIEDDRSVLHGAAQWDATLKTTGLSCTERLSGTGQMHRTMREIKTQDRDALERARYGGKIKDVVY